MAGLNGQVFKFHSREGSFTVELALVFPVVMLGIAATIYILLLLYQFVFIQALANKAAFRGAAEYGNLLATASLEESYLLLEQGRKESGDSGILYWQLPMAGNSALKEEILESYLRESLKTKQLLRPLEETVEVRLKDYIVYKRLEVKIVSEYQLPVLFVNKLLMMGDSFTVEAEAVASLIDPPGLIRSTDYMYELMDSFEATSSIKNSYLKAVGAWRRGMEDFFKE